MDKITEKLAINPNLLTYGMIGMTTVILAALTVFDSNTTDVVEEEPSYVSQLFNTEESSKEIEESKEEAGLLSSILPGAQEESGNGNTGISGGKAAKTRRHKKKHAHKKTRGTHK